MSKITKSARNEPCLVRIPNVCNGNPETTVFAHNNGAGMGRKSVDGGLDEGGYACSNCHTWLDGGYVNDKRFTATRETRDLYHHECAMRTRAKLIDKGLIKIVE